MAAADAARMDVLDTAIVTGAGGFIGRAVTRSLLERGFGVVGVYWPNAPQDANAGVVAQVADLTRAGAWRSLEAYGPAMVVHVAAAVPKSFERSAAEDAAAINDAIDESVFEFCGKSGSSIVYASSTSVDRIKTDYTDNAYAKQKFRSEGIINSGSGPKGCALRINAPYGPGQGLRTVMKVFIESALADRDLYYYGSGSRTQDFIHVDDIGSAFAAAACSGARGIFNLASGSAISMRDLAHLVVNCVPGSRSKVLAAGRPDDDEGYRANFDISETTKALGWIPRISLEDGIRNFARCLGEKA
jgi:UDP-glucose 4-epimerase